MFRKSFILKRRAAVSIGAGALALSGASRLHAAPHNEARQSAVRSNLTVLSAANSTSSAAATFGDARLAWRVRGAASPNSATITPAARASAKRVVPQRAAKTAGISVAATAWETHVARSEMLVFARTPGNSNLLRTTSPHSSLRAAAKLAKKTLPVRTTRLAQIVPPRIAAPVLAMKPAEQKAPITTAVPAPMKTAKVPVVAPVAKAKARGPVDLSARHKDRVLLAQLEADLARSDRNLDRAHADLSEGQKELAAFGGALRSAMLEAGPDAKGLHPFVRVAQRYAGTPYVWGGESARGFDCSGFIIRVMRDLGYKAPPHSAAEQFRYGMPVADALLKPGDLVFFANTYKPGISHVGIYLGRRRFIHAAGTGLGTIVSSLDASKFRAKYAGARRLVAQ